MNPLKVLLPVALAAGAVCPSEVAADPATQFRCSTDRLDATAALQRLEWARRCALTRNTAGAGSYISSTRAFDTTFNWAKDYVENNPNRAFSGNTNGYNVNYYYAYARYESTPMYTVFRETSGPTINFWKWSHTVQRARVLYPIFESTPVAAAGTQLFPLPTLPGSDCNLYARNASGFSLWPTASSFYVVAYCEVDP
jgi:hypothetical protein